MKMENVTKDGHLTKEDLRNIQVLLMSGKFNLNGQESIVLSQLLVKLDGINKKSNDAVVKKEEEKK